MAHNRSPSKIRADVLGSPLAVHSGWTIEVDCGGSCPRGRLYRVQALVRAHGKRTVDHVIRRFRCQVCGAGAITVVLFEAFERRRVPLMGPACGY